MKPANNKIIVSVDFAQKEKISIADTDFLLGKQYSKNRRESMPVVCKVENGSGHIKEGIFILVHHNRFTPNSPHHLGGNLYALAYNESIFARLDINGNAHSLCGNIIVNYIFEEYSIPVPEHIKQPHKFKYLIASNGFGYKKGQIIFAYEFANYEIVYVFNGEEKRVVKIAQNDIVGKIVR